MSAIKKLKKKVIIIT